MARLDSVNIGVRTVQPGSSGKTGIVKLPRTGPVLVDAEGLVGDVIGDRRNHGGPEQAVYLYLAADYAWWMAELGAPLEPGSFGENLTLSGLEGEHLAVGDRFAIGEVLLEVTWHRTPCATFSRRMGDPGWVRRFHAARRPGAYCRVLAGGVVEAGMDVAHRPFAGERFTVAELMAYDGGADIPPDVIRRVLAAPVRLKTRAKLEALLTL